MPIVKSLSWVQRDAINLSLYNRTIAGANRYVVSGELGGGSGSVTSLVAGSNLVLNPSPITTTGSIGLANSLSIPGDVQVSGAFLTYGNAHDMIQVGLLAVAGGGQSFYGNAGDNLGNSWYVTGSGWIQGTTVIKGNLTTDTLTVQVPTTFQKPIYANSTTGPNRFIPSGELGAGAGTVTNIALGSNLAMQPSPITVTGSIGLANSLNIPGNVQISGLLAVYTPTTISGLATEPSLIKTIYTATPTAASKAFYYGINLITQTDTSVVTNMATARLYGGKFTAQHQGHETAPLGLALGFSSLVQNMGGAVLSQGYGVYVNVTNLGSGTITTGYGLYLDDAASCQTPYAVYQAGTRDVNRWAGPTQFINTAQASGTVIAYAPIFANTQTGPNRYLPSGEISSTGGTGTVTNIAIGSNLTMQPSSITVTGSVGLASNIVLDGLQVSGGAVRTYGHSADRLAIGDQFAGNTGSLFYGNAADGSGRSWYLAGSGSVIGGSANFNSAIIAQTGIYAKTIAAANRYVTSGELTAGGGTGTVTNIALGSNLAMQPSPITVTGSIGLANSLNIPGDLQVSGSAQFYLPLYISASGDDQVTQRSLIGGARLTIQSDVASFSGVRYISSGHFANFFAGIQSNTPPRFSIYDNLSNQERFWILRDGGAAKFFSNTILAGDVQISGVTLAYSPIFVNTQTGPNRYITSGELPTGAGTGDFVKAAANYVTGNPIVFSPSTTVQYSGLTTFGATGNTKISAIGGLQASGAVLTYGNVGDRIQVGDLATGLGGQSFYGNYGDNLGNSWYLTGSGWLQGTTLIKAGIATDTFQVQIPSIFSNTSSVSVLNTLQISGIAIAYSPAYNRSVTGAQRYVVSGELTAGGGLGTVKTINIGSNLAIQPSPITVTGSIGLANSLNIPGDVQISGTSRFYSIQGPVGIDTTIPPLTQLEISSDANVTTRGLTVSQHNNSGAGAVIAFYKSRGSAATPTMVSGDDNIGLFFARAWSPGAGYQIHSGFGFKIATATVTSGIVPTDIVFSTGETAMTGIAQNEKFRITSQATFRMASGINSTITAPGAGYGMLRWQPGTNAGTLKLVAYAGTSTTGSTIIDNIGAGN